MICRLLRVNWSAIALALAVGMTTLQAETKPEEIYRRVLPSVMTLEIENNMGPVRYQRVE